MLYVIIRYALNKFEHKVAYHHVLKPLFKTCVLLWYNKNALNKFKHKVAYHHVLKLYFETRVLFITSHIRYKTEFNTDDKKA